MKEGHENHKNEKKQKVTVCWEGGTWDRSYGFWSWCPKSSVRSPAGCKTCSGAEGGPRVPITPNHKDLNHLSARWLVVHACNPKMWVQTKNRRIATSLGQSGLHRKDYASKRK